MDFLQSTHFGQTQQTQRAAHIDYTYWLKHSQYLIMRTTHTISHQNIYIENFRREALKGSPGGRTRRRLKEKFLIKGKTTDFLPNLPASMLPLEN